MRWFDKGRRKEIWDEEIQWPLGDIEAAPGYATSAVPRSIAPKKQAALPAVR